LSTNVVQAGRSIYFAQPIFTQYQKNAPRWCRALFEAALKRLLPAPVLSLKAPPTVVATVTRQAREHRQLVHLLHYLPVRTSAEVDIVEEPIPVHGVDVSLRAGEPVGSVRCVPEGTELPFTQADGRVAFTLPVLNGYQIVAVGTHG